VLINERDGTEQVFYKGLESVRTDWTELAKTFQADLFNLVFHDRDPSPLVKQVVEDTATGKLDHMLVYRKQLRRKLSAYVKNVPPHVRAARLADEHNRALGKSLRYQNKGWISYVMTTSGPEPVEYLTSPIDYDHYIDRQLKPVADGILPFIGLQFDAVASAQEALF
ncbi:MAG: DNA polymerase II, partial [Gammaproteobacteria bacterium]|nr:DNA polymerase II [Gammaproteobacteria bacterium]